MRKMLMIAVLTVFATTATAWAAQQRKTGTIISLDNAAKTFICHWGGEERAYKTTDKTVFRVGEERRLVRSEDGREGEYPLSCGRQ